MKKKKSYKKLTAAQASKMMTSEKAWDDLLRDIKYQAWSRADKCDTTYLPDLFKARLMALKFQVKSNTSTYKNHCISWENSPSVEEYDAMIKELTNKRDELRKEQLTKKLAGIR